MKLSSDQESALKLISKWFSSKEKGKFVLAGSAGTGKTTILKLLKDYIPKLEPIVCTFTGKASEVLINKGIDSTTIHKLLYNSYRDKETGKYTHTRKPKSSVRSMGNVIILDEGSMVPTEQYQDLLSIGLPILVVGDSKQLPPVNDKLDLMSSPDFVLTTPHRHREGSEIINYAMAAYEGKRIKFGRNDDVLKLHDYEAKLEELVENDIILCGFNNSRNYLNQSIRELYGYSGAYPNEGETVICKTNDYETGFINGKLYRVEGIDSIGLNKTFNITVSDLNKPENIYTVPSKCKNFIEYDDRFLLQSVHYNQALEFDYGYAITCHAAQGSEWPSVVVLDEPVGRGLDKNRWRYTAFTRAKESLTIIA